MEYSARIDGRASLVVITKYSAQNDGVWIGLGLAGWRRCARLRVLPAAAGGLVILNYNKLNPYFGPKNASRKKFVLDRITVCFRLRRCCFGCRDMGKPKVEQEARKTPNFENRRDFTFRSNPRTQGFGGPD